MKPKSKIKVAITILSFLLFSALLSAGCGGGYNDVFKKEPDISSEKKVSYRPTKDFNDIVVPKSLKLNEKSSYLIETPGFLGGILVYEGRVTRNSLMEFFKANMISDNWNMITSLKSPLSSSIMLFNKSNRWCIISISENRITTKVEIGVAPTTKSDFIESITDTEEPL